MADVSEIQDYAAIGNCHTVALISKTGSIDWWCPMRFDHSSVFAAILDAQRGGSFQIRPTDSFEVERRYLGPTQVLETVFHGQRGRLRVTDWMPLTTEDSKVPGLRSPHAIQRRIECLEGEVEVELRFAPRFDYGRVAPSWRAEHSGVLYATGGRGVLALRSELPLCVEGGRARGVATLAAGDRFDLALTFAAGEPVIVGPIGEAAGVALAETRRWWESWSGRCEYEGPYREAVLRSALVLKLLTYAPSGAMVAAPTTSLPETLGGERNWDYRYCWLRDASLTMRAFLDLGYLDEGRAFLGWLLHATHLTWPRLQPVYDVFGRTSLREREIDHLAGHRGSPPVRIGNAASEQLQLDLYGEVVRAAHEFIMRGGRMPDAQVRSLRRLGEVVCRCWREPDVGIWEPRTDPEHHTHSKVLCWCALDCLLRMEEHGHLAVPRSRFEETRRAIRNDVERNGYREDLGSYTQTYGSATADASLLLLSLHGFCQADAPRMLSTYRYLEQELTREGLWYRYPPGQEDGLEGDEGAFGICSFWAAEHMAQRGEVAEATAVFERMLDCANDVGLFAEEIDPSTGAALGNFPQAFTHVGLINAASAIERARTAERGGKPQACDAA